jgi:hypothetical protein
LQPNPAPAAPDCRVPPDYRTSLNASEPPRPIKAAGIEIVGLQWNPEQLPRVEAQ